MNSTFIHRASLITLLSYAPLFAATITYSNTGSPDPSSRVWIPVSPGNVLDSGKASIEMNYLLPKFNSILGTLTGVNLKYKGETNYFWSDFPDHEFSPTITPNSVIANLSHNWSSATSFSGATGVSAINDNHATETVAIDMLVDSFGEYAEGWKYSYEKEFSGDTSALTLSEWTGTNDIALDSIINIITDRTIFDDKLIAGSHGGGGGGGWENQGELTVTYTYETATNAVPEPTIGIFSILGTICLLFKRKR